MSVSTTDTWALGSRSAAVRAERNRRRSAIGNVVFSIVVAAVVAVWFVALRPQSLGGAAGYVMVQGVSMNPTYHTGDLVIVHERAQYRRGDIIAYRIPRGELGEGQIVIHRIVGGNPERGFVTQGDNNPYTDDWHPRPSDILGTPFLLVPKTGTLLSFLRNPLPFASAATSISVAVYIARDPDAASEKKRRRTERRARRRTRGPSPSPTSEPSPSANSQP